MSSVISYDQLPDKAKGLLLEMRNGKLLGVSLSGDNLGRAWIECPRGSCAGRQVSAETAALLVRLKLLTVDSEDENCGFRMWRVRDDLQAHLTPQ